MQFLLANPAWLWLLSLAVVPLLVHLFARSNPPKYAFSNTEFLRRIMKKTARMRKPQDWLLLLLRTLAVLALLFIFLQPLLTSDAPVQGGKKTTIYLIDRSASMACKDGASSRFAGACSKAVELLAADSSDAANVIWIDAEPDALFPQPGPNIEYIRNELKRSEVRDELGALSVAMQLATSQLEQVQGDRELVILSDFQSSAWKDFSLNVASDIKVVKVKIGDADVENVAVHELFATPSSPVVGQDVLMVCRLRNYSATPRRSTLYLEYNGGRQSRDVEIPAWGEAEINFKTQFSQAGLISINASIAEDVFPADDRRHALVKVREALKLVSVMPKKGSVHAEAPAVLKRLSGSLDWLEYREIKPGELPAPGTVDYLFIHAWDGKEVEKLHALAAAGTTLMVQPAVGCAVDVCEKLMGVPVTGQSTAIPVDSKQQLKAAISEKVGANQPIFALFQSGEFGNPVAGVFQSRLRFSKQWPESLLRLIDYQDGVPGLISTRKSDAVAPILLWNLPMSSKLSSWSGQTSFVPFMGELLLNSRAANQGRGHEVMPGSTLSWTPSDEVSPESVTLFDAAGQSQKTTIQMTSQGARLTSDSPAVPGIYQWKMGDGVAYQQVVNFPVTESDLRLMDPNLVQGGEVVDAKSLLRRAALGDGIPLWPWLVGLTVVFLLLESLVSMWKPKQK